MISILDFKINFKHPRINSIESDGSWKVDVWQKSNSLIIDSNCRKCWIRWKENGHGHKSCTCKLLFAPPTKIIMSNWNTSGGSRMKAKQNRSFARRAQQRANFVATMINGYSTNRATSQKHPQIQRRNKGT